VGIDITKSEFSDEDFERFRSRLDAELRHLEELVAAPGFGQGPVSLGAEVEMYLADAEGQVVPKNMEVISKANDPRLTIELNRFNLEFNSSPTDAKGTPFKRLGDELREGLQNVQTAAKLHGGEVTLIGILPTLRVQDLGRDAITDLPRYHALANGLRKRRGAAFKIQIDGREPLHLLSDDISPEGASTSFQVHLRVAPENFNALFNAIQLTTAPVLAASGNSPFFLGHCLSEETRIALFRQTVDSRIENRQDWRSPGRVTFGHGWLHGGITELFRESCALHRPLLPCLDDEAELGDFSALRHHKGTVWRWNRGI
jgi:hypothetical protein